MWRAFRRSEKDECSKTRELLSGYMDQHLNPEEVAHVEGHLGTCPGCREELEWLRATVALLHRLPEVTPSRSFAVAPVRPLPGRRALPALRFATAGVVLLLVLVFAVDQTDLFHAGDPSTLSFGPAVTSEEEEAYWLVPGERNEIADLEAMTKASEVNLVVPDGSDNVYTAVNSLATSGMVWGAVERGAGSVPQLVLTEGEEETASRGNAEEFAVLSASGDPQGKFAANDAAVPSALDSIIEGQDGSYLNILSSDNSTLYSFYLSDSRREVKAAGDNDWLRPLQYGLIGLVAVLGGAMAALWLRQRRQRVVGVSKSQN
jgi:hypothetical protein